MVLKKSKSSKKNVFNNPYRIMIGVLDIRTDQKIYSLKNLNFKQAKNAFKELELKFK